MEEAGGGGGGRGGAEAAAGSGSMMQFKRGLSSNVASPRSPLSPESPCCDSIDLAIDEAIADTSIEQLYSNIYEMKSSGQSSPSMCSFTTYGTSRIDAELSHLVGGREEEAEMIVKEEEEEISVEETRGEMVKDDEVKDDGQVVLVNQTQENGGGSKVDASSSSSSSSSTSSVATSVGKKKVVSKTGKVRLLPGKAGRDQQQPKLVSSSSSIQPKPLEKKPAITTRTSSSRVQRSIIRKPAITRTLKARNAEEEEEDRRLEMECNNRDLGPYLLRKAKEIILSSADSSKETPFDLVMRAKKSFESCVHDEKQLSLDYVLCLHILAQMHCSSGKYEEAIPLVKKSIEILDDAQQQQQQQQQQQKMGHALAKFAGLMQLGDIYAALGQIETSIDLYNTALEIQRVALGEKDARFGETCRYVAEAHVQALRFDEAEKLCQMALDAACCCQDNAGQAAGGSSSSSSIQEAADRRLMGLIHDSKGDHAAALEHYALASMAISSSLEEGGGQQQQQQQQQDLDTIAEINCNVGDAYLALARYEEAVCSYEKALDVFRQRKGENHPCVASVYVRLAELYNKVGKLRKSKLHCEKALKIYSKPPHHHIRIRDVACALVDLGSIFESMNELDRALQLLQRGLEIYKIEEHEGDNNSSSSGMIAGIEAQIGAIHYTLGNYDDSYYSLKSAALKLRSHGESSPAYGIALNQMGLACVQRRGGAVSEASELFKEAKMILEKEYGACHPDTLGVCSNLAATYDALGRWDEAIEMLEFVVSLREEKLGTANAIVQDEKRRLTQLLKEAGRVRPKKSRSLETLLDKYARPTAGGGGKE